MGILIAEQSEIFHVPFGSPNSEGTPEGSFVDVKTHPEWIPVLPSCIGWPETQALLNIINLPPSPFMSLATDQGFTSGECIERNIVLTSFVAISFSDISLNTKEGIKDVAEKLQHRLDVHLQQSCNDLGYSLHVTIRLELQPTRFHDHEYEGWSLIILMAASSHEQRLARQHWGLSMTALQTIIQEYTH